MKNRPKPSAKAPFYSDQKISRKADPIGSNVTHPSCLNGAFQRCLGGGRRSAIDNIPPDYFMKTLTKEEKGRKTAGRDANRDPITGAPGAHPVGTGLGAAAGGAATGAAIGSVAGPVGTAAGIVVGAGAGGVGGKG